MSQLRLLELFHLPEFIVSLSQLQIDFDVSGNWADPIIYTSQDDWSSNLRTILEWSPFASKEELMLQVHLIIFFL